MSQHAASLPADSKSAKAQIAAPPTGTRAALLDAGLHLFGHNGFASTSTRELADRAGTNVASIAYHFGSKEGLRLACGAEVARRIQAAFGPPGIGPQPSPRAAKLELENRIGALIHFLTGSSAADDLIAFMLREVMAGGPVLDRVYDTLIDGRHRELCQLWGTASGQDPDSDTVKLSVFAFVGQVLYFRIGRQIIARRMGWTDDGSAHGSQMAGLLIANLDRLLEQGDQP